MAILTSLPGPDDEDEGVRLYFSIQDANAITKAIVRHRLLKLTRGRSAKITRFPRGKDSVKRR